MQIVVPMAGAGSRYAEAGYTLPKPLIPVSGIPMVVRAVKDLPPAERIIFICQQQHLRDYPIEKTLTRYFPHCCLVSTPGLTSGQACTVRLAAPALDLEQPVIVAACDNTHLYDRMQLHAIIEDPSVDAHIWTYRGEPRVQVKPSMYGWVRIANGIDVSGVSVKLPISADPLNDHVVSGYFGFRTASLMLEAIDQLVLDDVRVNGEFYMDSVPNILLQHGHRVVAFEVDKYVGWGTPADLVDYERWERYFDGVRHEGK